MKKFIHRVFFWQTFSCKCFSAKLVHVCMYDMVHQLSDVAYTYVNIHNLVSCVGVCIYN